VCFPFTAMLAAGICHWIEGKVQWLAPLVLLVIAGTNSTCFFYIPGVLTTRFCPLLYSYIYEIHHPYCTAYNTVCMYFNGHAHPGETFYAAPEYMSYPVQYYTGDYLYNACVVDTTTYLGANRLRALSPRLLKEENFPDWFIAFGNHSETTPTFSMFSRELRDSSGVVYNHEYITDTVLPVFWDQTYRPEISAHCWGNKQPSGASESVLVYHKLAGGEQVWLSNFQKIIDAAVTFSDTTLQMTEFKKLHAVFLRDPALIRKNFAENHIHDFFKAYEQMLSDREEYVPAERVINTIMELEPGNGLNHFIYAKVMFGQHRYDRAIEICNNLIQSIPNIPFP